MKDLTKTEVAEKVQGYIKNRRADGIALEVMGNKIVKVNGWWRVPVRPDTLPKSISAYYEALADIEATIYENEGLNILLSSAQPADEDAVLAG